MDLFTRDATYIANTYRRFPVALVSGKGSLVYDGNGKEYIDMGSGIGVTAFGFADDVWQKAVTEQITQLQHASNLYYTKPCVDLAELLCERTGMKKVFFSNSGAEANECAIKAARKWAAEKHGSETYTIVTLENSFHGRTLATLAATGQDAFHKDFQPLPGGFCSVPAGDLAALRRVMEEQRVAAVMLECVQGEGGVIALETEYLQGVEALVREYDALLIVDEVQTGNGRCGSLYAYMQAGLRPDLVSTAKGLAGGLPLGATLFSERVEHALGFGDHGSTFGGNPVSCAAALSVLQRIDEGFLEDVRKKGEAVFAELEGAPGVEGLSGKGLMIGVKTTKPAADVLTACREKGVLFLSAKDKVRMLPALNIPMPELMRAVNMLKEVCAS